MPKNAENYFCEICDFKCCKQSNFEKHTLTLKHKIQQNTTHYSNKKCQKMPKNYPCLCGKIYNHRASLYNHKKKCTENKDLSDNRIKPYEQINDNNDNLIDVLINENKDCKNVILEMMKSNTELQKQFIAACKENTTTTNLINNTNSHNKTFNLQFFLNEQCKDAMNIMDFVNSVTLQLSDLEETICDSGEIIENENKIIRN